MRITFRDNLPAHTVDEAGSFTVVAKFWDDTDPDNWATSTPSTVRWRIDDPDTGITVTEWTTATASSSATITVNGNGTTLNDQSKDRERRVLTVQANNGLSNAYVASHQYYVRNSAAY